MFTRRAFLQSTGTAGLAAAVAFRDDGFARVEAAARRVEG